MSHWRSRPEITDRSVARFRAVWLGCTAALILAAVVLAFIGTASGQDLRGNGMAIGTFVGPLKVECPPQKPHKRIVEGQFSTCTLVACIGKLICDDAKCWRGPATDCNTCSRSPDTEICLSSEELERAR